MLLLRGKRKASFVPGVGRSCLFRTGCSFLCEPCRFFLVWEKGLIRFPCDCPEWGEVFTLSTERNYQTGI